MKELPLAEIPILPLEQLLVAALDQPGARRLCASEQFEIGYATPTGPDAPNVIPYGHGSPEETMCVMAGDGIRDFPAIKRTFLRDNYAIVYKAERVSVIWEDTEIAGTLNVLDERLYEELEIHEISQDRPVSFAKRIFHISSFKGTNSTITDIEELKSLDGRAYVPKEIADAVLNYVDC